MFLQDHLTQYFVILLYVHRPFTLNTPHSKFLNYFLLGILVSLTYLRAQCKLSMTTNFSVNSQWAAILFYINRAFLFQDPSSCLLPFLKEMRPPQQMHGRLKSFSVETSQGIWSIDVSSVTGAGRPPADAARQPQPSARPQPQVPCDAIWWKPRTCLQPGVCTNLTLDLALVGISMKVMMMMMHSWNPRHGVVCSRNNAPMQM